MTRGGIVASVTVLLLALVGAAAWFWWPGDAPAPVATAPLAVTTAPPPAPPEAPPAPASAAAEEPLPEPKPDATPLAVADVQKALIGLLGAKPVQQWLQLDDFMRRVVATVDNLGRAHAASMLWPVEPTRGRFSVLAHEGRTVINPDNAQRYVPFVQWVETLDLAATADLYVRLLPLLQQAYEDLGYPGKRFHTRLIQVIDHLLAAPEPQGLVAVQQVQVRGPIASERPWVRQEFVDPALEAASAGHKLMVRIGAPNQRRLKATLRQLRAALQRRAVP
jgi:hypothetical protein